MKKNEEKEDSTKYGEFVSSYFAWLSLPKQKSRAKELEQMTKETSTYEDEFHKDIKK